MDRPSRPWLFGFFPRLVTLIFVELFLIFLFISFGFAHRMIPLMV